MAASDDRFTFLNLSSAASIHLLDDLDDKQGWDLPDDDIQVPLHLLPAYQDEDDETVLPSSTHPSYPYGNPYLPTPGPSVTNPTTTHTSLSTSLPVLSLKHLHSITTFGEPRERGWSEMGLDAMLGEEERGDDEEKKAGEATAPTGQNAGDGSGSERGEMEEED
ncbi:hypothetical protein MNV49_001442 [Pseudohyphozyma bogoriensis]|nr:hypothetical protein MNV49_001442 [Pseudohyphozyma bogoriensis]